MPLPPAEEIPRRLVSAGRALEHHLARPPSSAARDASRPGLVIVHGLPTGPGRAKVDNQTLPELADRIAAETGWAALSFSLSGTGASPGRFGPAVWLGDVVAAVELMRSQVSGVWLAGFGFGGVLALQVAGADPTVGGVAVLATPSDLSDYAADPAGFAEGAREAGMLDTPDPEEFERWPEEFRAVDPLRSAALIPPRPLLIVHGSADEDVPLVDARALADAALGEADLRVVPMAGHQLRHDPRAIAILLGWLERRQT